MGHSTGWREEEEEEGEYLIMGSITQMIDWFTVNLRLQRRTCTDPISANTRGEGPL